MVDAIALSNTAIGKPLPRYESRAKVTGSAQYASDFELGDTAYAYIVPSTIASGRIRRFDLDAARQVSGVLDILTYENMHDAINTAGFILAGGWLSETFRPMHSADVAFAGQIIAIVLANSFEAAREAAHRVQVDYEAQIPAAAIGSPGAVEQTLASQRPRYQDPKIGDFDTAYPQAEVKIEAEYSTPAQHHNPMELFATQCVWNGPHLTIYEATQNLYNVQNGVAAQLGMDPSFVRVINPYIGGAFGGRSNLTQRTAIIAIAARRLGRPVKLVASRDQGFTLSTHRAETRHQIKLGATREGKLVALQHLGWEVTSRHDPYAVAGTATGTRMYACPNITTRVNLIRADRTTPGFMRGPPETPYLFALESAMDELAVALQMDPVKLRRINEPDRDPILGLPYTSRSLMACYEQAAAAFGWSKRDPHPASMSNGDWLVGWGCASGAYPTNMGPTSARVTVFPDGRVRVATGTHEMGNGVYTVIAQTAADILKIPMDKVTVLVGDTNLPPTSVSAGSQTTASVCNTVAQACLNIRKKLSASDDISANLMQKLAERGGGAIEEYIEWVPYGAPKNALELLHKGAAFPVGGSRLPDRVQFSFGAHFVEVRVHAETREIRMGRMVSAFGCGRIMNTRLARSQLMSGLIWGVGSALLEVIEIDPVSGRYANNNIAEYPITVNADVRDVEVIFVEENDTLINPLGIKGIGEVGITGVNAAVANAVYHATGRRVRSLPIHLDDLL
jgi:xanthine dehydrogenase YagR molybdenum-binding subunit